MAQHMKKEICSSLSHSRMKAAKTAANACEICGMTNDLQVHHVDKNPRNNVPSNLRTLCRSCHARCHSPNFTETGELRNPCVYCNKPSMKRGLCYTHLSRFKRFGHPLAKKKKNSVRMGFDASRWKKLVSSPLECGATNRVGRLRGYGNAIVAPQAEAFIRAYMEITNYF